MISAAGRLDRSSRNWRPRVVRLSARLLIESTKVTLQSRSAVIARARGQPGVILPSA